MNQILANLVRPEYAEKALASRQPREADRPAAATTHAAAGRR